MATDLNELQEIERLAEEKERQWHSAATRQIKTLQKELVLKSRYAEEMELKFSQLKADFKYNLKVLCCALYFVLCLIENVYYLFCVEVVMYGRPTGCDSELITRLGLL